MAVIPECIEYVGDMVAGALARFDPCPDVRIGGFTVEKPFCVYVCEEPQSVSFSDVSTSHVMGQQARGLYRVEFDVMFQLQAVRREIWDAALMTLEWFDAVARAVANDKTLGGLAIHAAPYFSQGGTAKRDRQFVHVSEGGVHVKADFNPRK